MSTTTNEILTSEISNTENQSSISNAYIESVIGTPRTTAGNSPPIETVYDNYIYQDSTDILRSESATLGFNSVYEARAYLDKYIKDHFKTTATIPDVNGVNYIVNIANVLAYNLVSDTIEIEFDNTDILTITCLNSTHASLHYTYLNHLYTGYNIYDTFTGTRIEVNEGESIMQAVQGATAGDLVIVNTGTYTESIKLKNGVDIYFMENCVLKYLSASDGIFNDRLGFVVCNIYGFPDITAVNCLIVGLWNNNSSIYLEANEINQSSTSAGCFYQYCDTTFTSKIKVKGFSLNKLTGSALGISDFDGYGNIFCDYDFIKMAGVQCNLSYGFSHDTGNYLIFRNMYSQTGAYVTIEGSNFYQPSIMNHIFVNCRFRNTNAGAGSIFLQYDPITDGWAGQHKAYFYSCYFQQTGKCIDATYSITSYMYGSNYSSIDKDSQVTLAGTGTLTIDSNLTISEV